MAERLAYKNFLLILMFLIPGFLNYTFCLAQSAQKEEERAMDERTMIKAKIKELEKVLQEKPSPEAEKQLGVLKKLEETINAEVLKAQEQRIREKDLQLTQEVFEIQQKRIKEVEEKINQSLLSPEGKGGGGKNYESSLPPEKTKEIEDRIDKEALYFTCRAALEEKINPCEKIKIPDSRQRCRNIFESTYMLSQTIKNKQFTPEALEACRQLKDSLSEEDCRLIGQTCLSGDASEISSLPYFEWAAGRFELALISGKEKHCLGLMKEELQNCLNAARYTSAIRSGDPEACAKIKGGSLNALCKLYFNKDSSICESLLE